MTAAEADTPVQDDPPPVSSRVEPTASTAAQSDHRRLPEKSGIMDDFGLPRQSFPAPVAGSTTSAQVKGNEEASKKELASRPTTADDAPTENPNEGSSPIDRRADAQNGDETHVSEDSIRSSRASSVIGSTKTASEGSIHEEGKQDVAQEQAQEPVKTQGVIERLSQRFELPPDTVDAGIAFVPARASGGASEWSHQQVVPQKPDLEELGHRKDEEEWQEMPAFAPFDLYDDDGKLIAREAADSDDETAAYNGLGGASKGYTRVNLDEDAQSATSMDENTRYLFENAKGPTADEDDEEARDPLAQLQATKDLLTEPQKIAYVGVTRVGMVEMMNELEAIEGTRATKKDLRLASESLKMWGQKMMVRLYAHMEISSAEQVMIEQLAEHGVQPADLTPTLMQNSRVKNPMASKSEGELPQDTPRPEQSESSDTKDDPAPFNRPESDDEAEDPPPAYEKDSSTEMPEVRMPSQLPKTQSIEIDLRWTVLCDLFLVLIADSVYDARSRTLLERVGSFLDVPWLELCRFEKRVTDALEMQEAADKESWDESEHLENRRKLATKRRIMMMGLATVGGSLVIGLSAGLLAPVIGAGIAAGFTTIGVAGTSGFLAGTGGAAVITTLGVTTGGTIAVRASSRRTGHVRTFEYRPLHNNKRVNLILTVAGWMNGKVDDVRLPYSTVDPIMGDVYSLLWEPEMLQSMGQTINILATEALTQGLQQVLGSTVLVALMASLQLPIVLAKLSYLIDNPWSVSLDRANAAGLILADSLIDRNLGVRPVTLVGFSLGARVIFSCLKELASKAAFGVVQNVYLFGAPIVAKKDEYLRARAIVSGRFVNGYATNDWILGYLFRATSGGIMRVAGLAPVEEIPGLENINVTSLVNGHMAYRAAMPRLLREVGWMVESDEFVEIEDPDPENHQKRQREIIKEIDEARKELEKKPEKRKFGFFGRNKKATEKKAWETYDDRMKAEGSGSESPDANGLDGNVLFDIDAIRAELASEQIEVKQLESTLPPMKLDTSIRNWEPERSLGSSPASSGIRKNSLADVAIRAKNESTSSLPAHLHSSSTPQNRSPLSKTSPLKGPSMDGGSIGDGSEPKEDPAGGQTPPVEAESESAPTRPDLRSSKSMPAAIPLEHNAWLDEDEDFGKEKEITMSFA
ncbi:MAG: hypothetical protein M1817_005048 [Caeruleum heppii]|nr:MAG: hypothetical protein M1817_005048 [Caeruleum heppii]